jgi:hypothetical protein
LTLLRDIRGIFPGICTPGYYCCTDYMILLSPLLRKGQIDYQKSDSRNYTNAGGNENPVT